MENKYRLYNKAQQFGTESSFIANVIITGMTRPTKKLTGLVKLLESGHEVHTAQFDMFTLFIDGQPGTYQALEAIK